MKFILKITDSHRYSYVSVEGNEPLRNYRRTKSLLQSRLADSYPEFADMLAVPKFYPDGNIEWSTDTFDSLPRPLTAVTGGERKQYDDLLQKCMLRLRDAFDALPAEADVAEFHAVAAVPSADSVYCADNRIVFTEWGLRPLNGVSALPLLSLADTVEEKPKVKLVPDKENIKEKQSIKESSNSETKKQMKKSVVPPVVKEQKTDIPVIPPTVVAPPPVVDDPKKGNEGGKKRWWLWLIIAVIILSGILAAVLLLTRCSSAEKIVDLPQTSPEISQDDIVLSRDSTVYVVSDRLNIMVLKGGSLDDFIKDFRRIYPDKQRYSFSAPDTLLNHIVLTAPADEIVDLKNDIPVKMKPKYRVITATESLNQLNYVPSDPAMQSEDESYYFDMINALQAWDIQKGDPDVVVAVLDDGFDTNHPEIQGKVKDAYDIYTHSYGTKASKSGHGQHTSGTAVGIADNGYGACGVAPGCTLMPVNVFTDSGMAPDSMIIKGLVYAAKKGAKVVSCSIGRYFGPMVKFLSVEQQLAMVSQILPDVAQMYDEVFRTLDEMGVTVVLAAGNETILAQLDPMKRSEYPIIVSAVDRNGGLAIFDPATMNGTNWGDRTDISAPGVDIYNSIPGGYDYMSGTSMACPQVAGGAALVMSQYPDLKPQQVKELLVRTAIPVDENIGPLMDLAAALQSDPNNLPPAGGDYADNPNNMRRGRGDKGASQDPYSFYYLQTPEPPTNEHPEQRTLQPDECEQAILQLQQLQRQYEAILSRYGACL